MKEYYHEEKVRNRYILSPQERKTRKEFVRKVCLIMIGQLFITICATILASFHPAARDYLNENVKLGLISILLMAIFTMFLVFCSWTARLPFVSTTILILLTAFTSFWMTCLCVKYTHSQVGISTIVTIFLAFTLGIFAMHTTHDFTVILGVLLVVSLIAVIMSVLHLQWIPSAKLKWAILIGSIILTSVYFLSDMQMIISGDRTFFLDMESHVLGACIMYIDFVYLFVYVLMIYGDIPLLKLA